MKVLRVIRLEYGFSTPIKLEIHRVLEPPPVHILEDLVEIDFRVRQFAIESLGTRRLRLEVPLPAPAPTQLEAGAAINIVPVHADEGVKQPHGVLAFPHVVIVVVREHVAQRIRVHGNTSLGYGVGDA